MIKQVETSSQSVSVKVKQMHSTVPVIRKGISASHIYNNTWYKGIQWMLLVQHFYFRVCKRPGKRRVELWASGLHVPDTCMTMTHIDSTSDLCMAIFSFRMQLHGKWFSHDSRTSSASINHNATCYYIKSIIKVIIYLSIAMK